MNNNYDEIDKLLFKYFENNQEVPNSIIDTINYILQTKVKKFKIILYIKKIIITILGLVTITGGVVFAKDLKIFALNLFENLFGNYNNGLSNAIDNGYIQNVEMKYIESNNIKIKVEQATLDDYNLGLIFKIEVINGIDLTELFDIKFKNLLIIDENNNVLFSEYENQEDFIKYCKENNLYQGKYNIGLANCPANGKILEKNENNITYSFYTTSEKFPKSKYLKIKFDKIYFLNNKVFDEKHNIEIDNHYATIQGNWIFDINLEDLYKKRKNIEYTLSYVNDNETFINKATLSMTNMYIELTTSSNKIDFEKLQNRKQYSIREILPFHDEYLEISNGKKFLKSSSNNNGFSTIEDGKIKYYITFDYTYFEQCDEIKIVLPTNKNQELILKLNKFQ